MEIDIKPVGDVQVITLRGELNSETATDVHQTISKQVTVSGLAVLDMSDVSYMSSAGIRTLLLLYRSFKNNGGKVVLVGLSEDLQDTLSLTGFLEFFNTQQTLDAGLKAIQ